MNRIKLALISVVILVVLLSCGLPTVSQSVPPTTDPEVLVAQALAQTQLFQTQVAVAAQLTIAAGGGVVPPPPAALPTYTFQPTYTIQLTNTPSTATVTVSIDTNCRTGPGSAYPIIGALIVGQTAEVVGRSASSDNWIVKLPGKAVACWLWGQYATVTGSTSSLPIIAPPPIPATITPSTITITIYNDCIDTIFYAYISGSDDPRWGSDELGASSIPIGGTYTWIYNPGTYDIKVENSSHILLGSWFALEMTTNQYLVACP